MQKKRTKGGTKPRSVQDGSIIQYTFVQDKYRWFYEPHLQSLSRILDEIRAGKRPPVIVILGAPGTGKSTLARVMVTEGKAVWLLDCKAIVSTPEERIMLGELDMSECQVFVVDNFELLAGQQDLAEFYERLRKQHTVLILIGLHSAREHRGEQGLMGFAMPQGTALFQLDRKYKLVLET
jgi:ATPase family associated with various cellular activities (AAA).